MTLIEILAATVILSSMLAGIIIAKGRAERQFAHADRRRIAVAYADQLLAEWWAAAKAQSKQRGSGEVIDMRWAPGYKADWIPVGEQGQIEGFEHIKWQTKYVDSTVAPKLFSRIVELAFYIEDQTDERKTEFTPIVSIEVMVPMPVKEVEEKDKKKGQS